MIYTHLLAAFLTASLHYATAQTTSPFGATDFSDGPGMQQLLKVIKDQEKAPTVEDKKQLSDFEREYRAGILMVGQTNENGTAHGTAFVISRKNRLLVTNAHVADIAKPGTQLNAIMNGTTTQYQVEKVWYHPGLNRVVRNWKVIRSMDPNDGPTSIFSPDIAVLQLAEGGPELPVELPLASWDEIKDLFARQVGMLGYPGYDSSWPAPGHKPVVTVHEGIVSRLTDFNQVADADPRLLQFVQHTAASWPGFSGSPLFLPNGHVVAVHNSSLPREYEKRTTDMPHGIRIDALWELLIYHQLDSMVAIDPNRPELNVNRFKEPDPESEKIRKAVALVDQANSLRQQGKTMDAWSMVGEAIELASQYPASYVVRWLIVNDIPDYLKSESWLKEQLDDAQKYTQLAPSDLGGPLMGIETAYNLYLLQDSALPTDKWDLRKYKQLQSALTQITELPNPPSVLGRALLRRALLLEKPIGDLDGALADYNAMIQLAPHSAKAYRLRAAFQERQGKKDLADKDRATADELEKAAVKP